MQNTGAEFMKREMMFTKCTFCKIFEATSEHPTGWVPHYHDYTQIWYVDKGCCEHWLENKQYIMTVGDTFILPPNMEHKTILQKDTRIICCEVALESVLPQKRENEDYEQMDKSVLDLISMTMFMQRAGNMNTNFAFSPETERHVGRLMKSMLEEYNKGLVFYNDFLRVQIQELLLMFAREFELSPEHDSTVEIYTKNKALMEKAIAYINDHYADQLTLEDICKISTLSRTYFCYLFKLMTQQTFIAYLMNVRIQKAAQMLENPQLSITYIGEAVGFNDSTNFSRTFRKLIGIPPREYRRLKIAEHSPAGK